MQDGHWASPTTPWSVRRTRDDVMDAGVEPWLHPRRGGLPIRRAVRFQQAVAVGPAASTTSMAIRNLFCSCVPTEGLRQVILGADHDRQVWKP